MKVLGITTIEILATTLLFGDNWVISFDHLEIVRNELLKIARENNMEISTAKTKALAFRGKSSGRAKIVMNDKVVEQISMFKWD
jgi:hypothetical protein